jgi:hypothetical protein
MLVMLWVGGILGDMVVALTLLCGRSYTRRQGGTMHYAVWQIC